MMPTGWCPGARTIPAMLDMYPGTSAVRVFFAPGEGLPPAAWSDPTWPARQRLTDLPAGCTVIVSFKDQLVDRAAFVEAWQQHRPDVRLDLITHHEPEQQTGGDPTRAQYRASWTRTREQVGAHPARAAGRLRLAVCFTLVWIRKGGDWRYWFPDHEAVAVDLVLGDWYPYMPGEPNPWKPRTYEDPAAALKVLTDIAAATGKPWGIAEIDHTRITKANGYAVDLDLDGTKCAAWYRRMHATAKQLGCQVWAHFHYGHADGTTGDLTNRLPEQQALRDLIAQEEATGMIVSGIRYVEGRNAYGDRDGTKYGIAIHNTSNTASAADEASYATRRTDGISSHFYGDDSEVIQSLDTKWRAGHAGSYEGNEHAVAVEITGTNDKSREWWIANVAWDQLGRVLAAVCRKYDIEPRRASVSEMKSNPRVRAFYSHNDMRQAWGGTTHTDPGPNFPWDYLFAAVKANLTGEPVPVPQEDDVSAADVITGLAQALAYAKDPAVAPNDDLARTGRQIRDNLRAIIQPVAAQEGTSAAELSTALAGLPKTDVDQLAAAIAPKLVASLPADSPITDQQLERVLRTVLGSVDNAPQAG